ncbi:MAG: septum formation initiator family protein [Thermodesulfobacteriota bacterium]|nr:septum formation initiator family protein [Thermodesulfobacteriota bacterium]
MRHTAGLGISVFMLLLLVFTIPGEKGLIRTYHLHQELMALKAQNVSLKQEKYLLAQEAFLLKEDRSYIEHTIIKEMNLVKQRDIVVVFKGKKK